MAQTTGTNAPWLTIEQLAERWQDTVRALYARRHRGQMPRGVKLGRELRFHIDDVEEYERRQREAASERPR